MELHSVSWKYQDAGIHAREKNWNEAQVRRQRTITPCFIAGQDDRIKLKKTRSNILWKDTTGQAIEQDGPKRK